MKKTRRFAATIAAMALAATMVAPTMMNTFAEGETTTITMKEGDSTSAASFSAYKILDASVSGTAYSYTVNSKYRSILQAVIGGSPTDDAIIDAISQKTDAAEMRTFADAVYVAIKAATPAIAADATSSAGVFSDVDQGYYLIAETAKGNSEDTLSLVMVDTKGDTALEVTTKKEAPSFQKKIMDKNDSASLADDGSTNDAWQDSADYDGGDQVPFQLTATLPDDLASYSHYSLNFYDNLEDSVFSYDAGSAKVYLVHDGSKTEITGGFTITTPGTEDNNFSTTKTGDKNVNLKVAIADLKSTSVTDATNTSVTAVAGDQIVVEYTATLNANTAVIGPTGNWNSAYLEYSNNPYNSGAGDNTTSKTPEDLVVAFTYKVVVNKVDGSSPARPLEGATFQLWKEGSTAGEYTQVGSDIVGTDSSVFIFERIDAGNYKIVELAPPAGYKKADDVYFTVRATHEEKAATPSLTNLVVHEYNPANNTVGDEWSAFSPAVNEGKVETEIKNTSGSALPSTGGMGTKLFIAGGGITATLAALYLVTKKRSGKEEE